MRSGNEKPAGNTLCIAKGFEAAWAFFCPAKPCESLPSDGKKREAGCKPHPASCFLFNACSVKVGYHFRCGGLDLLPVAVGYAAVFHVLYQK